MTNHIKKTLTSLVLIVSSMAGGLLMIEGVLRLQNASMKNYDIEMWRYAKELKVPSGDPDLGHEHLPNVSSTLQSVLIRTNRWGLRGGEIPEKIPGRRDILVLGSSIALGWGVREEDTLSARLEEMFKQHGQKALVMNAGIGNYNAPRYVKRFFTRLKDLHPTDILVHAFLRDAEPLEQGGGNWFLRHSQLAVTLWNIGNRLLNNSGDTTLVDHYAKIYAPASPGLQAMENSLGQLADYAKKNNIRLYLAMTPDVHNLKKYPLEFAHQAVKSIADKWGYRYLDLLPALSGLSPEEVWSMRGDPHPNSLGHKLMAESIYPVLADPIGNRTLGSTQSKIP